MVKFNRNYLLQIERSDGEVLTITPPFTLEFEVNHNNMGASSFGRLRVYNLSKINRDAIRKDQWGGGIETATLRKVTLNAGYNQQLSNILVGNIVQAWSVREGDNFITEIVYQPGLEAFVNARTNTAFPVGTSYRSIIKSVMRDLKPYGVTEGAIGNYSGTISRGSSFSGNSMELLKELTGSGAYIFNDQAYCLKDQEHIPGTLDVINPDTGLLNTPTRQYNQVAVEILFEPRIIMKQRVTLESITDESFNGPYTVIGIRHRGMISPTVCGTAVTSLTLVNVGNSQEVASAG